MKNRVFFYIFFFFSFFYVLLIFSNRNNKMSLKSSIKGAFTFKNKLDEF